MPSNRLVHQTSPYLLQHAHNPVDWYPWGAEAFEKARREDIPILLSVGYSACHWCHVMERECFENPQIAEIMNSLFVNVKVDREERPDVDQVYMTAVQMLTGQGGWPMTVFLTPEGRPFYGGTYFPPHDMLGRPGFPRILKAVHEAWSERREAVLEQSAAVMQYLERDLSASEEGRPLDSELFAGVLRQLQSQYDARYGGFGSAPKFPQPMLIDLLFRLRDSADGQALEMALQSLRKMSEVGIHDQVGGGFHRYSTDTYWLVPHFEKMLYDNAQLASAYLHGWMLTGDRELLRTCTRTLDYVRREMTSPDGGFYSATDADSEGEEGRYFVWTLTEVQEVLGAEDAALFCRFYDITPRGNWEGRNIPNASGSVAEFAAGAGVDPDLLADRLDAMCLKLRERRMTRVPPLLDDKIITAWNALMISAFAEAGAALVRQDYLQAAEDAARFITQNLLLSPSAAAERFGIPNDGGRVLMRTGRFDEATHRGQGMLEEQPFRVAPTAGFLEDYAGLGVAMLDLHRAVQRSEWLDTAEELGSLILARFRDEDGRFYDAAQQDPSAPDALPVRPVDDTDNAVPSGTSLMVELFLRLYDLLEDEQWLKPAMEVLHHRRGWMERHPMAYGRLLQCAHRALSVSGSLVIVGRRADADAAEMLSTAAGRFAPNLSVIAVWEEDRTIRIPAAEGCTMVDGRATAYYCIDRVCGLPITSPADLARVLNG
jgi:uncharacterized protein YyaL (SSP411 family)